ncbi:MAG: tyrosine-type recombinase/integrase [Coriobacteriia bacterium]|nr:tyrosine-type recombinase/integrase [Coriobacteriia bacterium]
MRRWKSSPRPDLVTEAEINSVDGICLRVKGPDRVLYGQWRTAGKPREKRLGTTRDECVENLAALATMLGRTVSGSPHDTLNSVALAWWAQYDASPATLETYRYAMNIRVLPALGHREVSRITVKDVETFRDTMDGNADSRTKAMVVLRHVLDYAVSTGRTISNPAANVRTPTSTVTHRYDYLPLSDVRKLADAAPLHYRSHILAMGYLGLRVGELAALTVDDLTTDEHGTCVNVPRGATKTDSGERTIPVPQCVVGDIVFGTDKWLFPNINGDRLDTHSFRNRFRDWVTKSGVKPHKRSTKPITPHTLRKSALTAMADAQIPLADLAAIAGHASPDVTYTRYVARNRARLQQAVDKLK